jgi:hypothetical protein
MTHITVCVPPVNLNPNNNYLLVNEPVQFLVGRSRVRYEVVINWVEKDRAGGYLAVPKDKALSSAGVPVKK